MFIHSLYMLLSQGQVFSVNFPRCMQRKWCQLSLATEALVPCQGEQRECSEKCKEGNGQLVGPGLLNQYIAQEQFSMWKI